MSATTPTPTPTPTPTTATTSSTAMEVRQRPWWLTLILGILAFIVGALLLFGTTNTKIQTWQTLIVILGLYWLIGGVVEIVHMFTDHRGWGWKLFIGIISIIAGGYILMYPTVAAVELPQIFVLVLGIWGLIQGIMLLIVAFRGGGWGAGILGALGIIFGLILIANYSAPGMGLTLIWVAAIFGLIGGVVMVIQAFRQRSATA